jgi:DNA-directed RNA polymerase subunit H (RpoH/RPB5)
MVCPGLFEKKSCPKIKTTPYVVRFDGADAGKIVYHLLRR